MVYLSPRHGVNPSLDLCFFCQEPKGVVLFGRMGTSVQKAHGELAAQPAPQVAGPTVGAMCEDMDAICECGDVWGNHSSVPPHAGGRDGAPLCTSFKKKES
jgi:hypothetical protein